MSLTQYVPVNVSGVKYGNEIKRMQVKICRQFKVANKVNQTQTMV
jgi:hypothetical protein